jgi:vacuolar-type H+-ATPase subunit C/Vma6
MPLLADRRKRMTRKSYRQDRVKIASFRTQLQHGYTSGRLAVRTAVSIDSNIVELLLEARDSAERGKLLSDTIYGPFIVDARNLAEFEAGLDEAVADAIELLGETGADSALEEYFRLDVPYHSGSEHEYFAEKMRLAQQTDEAFLIQATQLEIDCANVRLIMRKRIAGFSAKSLADANAIIEGGSINSDRLMRIYREKKDTHDLAMALITLDPFHSIDPLSLEDVYTLDIALRGVQERFYSRASRFSVGPDVAIAYALRVKSEVELLRAMAVGLANDIDPRLLRRYLVAR